MPVEVFLVDYHDTAGSSRIFLLFSNPKVQQDLSESKVPVCRTAGAEGEKYSFVLSNKNLRIKKRIFLTASSKRYFLDSNKRDADGEPTPLYLMDQQEI